jgi:hypothetical protein
MQTPATSSPSPESNCPDNGADEPEKHVDEVNPDGTLHPLYSSVPLRVLLDVHIPKETEYSRPEDEEDSIPGEEDSSGE